MKTKPQFIVIAGCEGGGKTTVIERIKAKYPDMLYTREPGGTEFAEKGPRYLVLSSPWSPDLNGYEQITQAFSGRSHHVRNVIAPALVSGKSVISDRFDCCSFAYQIFGMGKDNQPNETLFGLFEQLRLSIVPMTLPDLYIILDVSPEIGMQRTRERAAGKGENNYFDKRGAEFHARVRKGYERFAQLNSTRVKFVDAHQSRDKVWESIDKILVEQFAEPPQSSE